jgi:hypothetical protein
MLPSEPFVESPRSFAVEVEPPNSELRGSSGRVLYEVGADPLTAAGRMNEGPREPWCELGVRNHVLLDKCHSPNRDIAVESDEGDGDAGTATFAPQLSPPELEPLPIIGTPVLFTMPKCERLYVPRMVGE